MTIEVLEGVGMENDFNFIDTRTTLMTNCTQQWRKLLTHFTSLEQSLSQKSREIDSNLQTLDLETKITLESLDQRENSLYERESSLIARIEEQKVASLSEFKKTLSKWAEIGETLKSLCRKMDHWGLLEFMTLNMIHRRKLNTQIVLAIEEAVDPPRLVLGALDVYMEKKNASKAGFPLCRTPCRILLGAWFAGVDKTLPIAASVAERAATVADAWKVMMEDTVNREADFGRWEGIMFLELVVGFGLVSKFEKDFLLQLVRSNPSARFVPRFASAFGLGEKVEDLIDELVKSGNELDAVSYICKYGFTERFPPVDLLMTYFTRITKEIIPKLNDPSSGVSDFYFERDGLGAFIECVEDNKLESTILECGLKKCVFQFQELISVHRFASRTKRIRGDDGSSDFHRAKFARPSDSYSHGYQIPGPAYQKSSTEGVYMSDSGGTAVLPRPISLPPNDIVANGFQGRCCNGAQMNSGAVAPYRYQPPGRGVYQNGQSVE